MVEPQTAKVSVDGKKINPEDLPNFVEFPDPRKGKTVEQLENEQKEQQWFYESENITDFTDLQEVSRAINVIKIKKAKVNEKLKVARKKAAGAKYYYERAKRRQIVTVSGSSDRVRQAMAEIYTEELETEWIVASTVEEEYKSLLRNLTKEAEDLKEISYNIRKELELLKVQA